MGAKVITVFNQKGGCGKTTATMHLAGTLGLRGKRVLVVDTDEQGTATRWAASATDERPFPATVVGLAHAGAKVHREIRNHFDNYDYIVVDCPPSAESAAAASALLVSDLALVPIIPSPADAWAVVAAKSLIQKAQVNNEALRARLLPNAMQKTSIAGDVMAVLAEDEDLPVLGAHLNARSAFRECQIVGGTVHSVGRDKKAIAEVESVVNAVLALL